MTRKDLREARCIQLFEATIGSIAYNGFAKTTLNGVASFEQAWVAMRQLAEEGGYDDIDPVATAHAFNAMIDGLWLEIMVNPNGCNADLARRACRDFLARAFPKESSAATALSAAA